MKLWLNIPMDNYFLTKTMFMRAMMLTAIILMDLLAGTEFDLFVPSFPEIQNHFMLSPVWVEALLSVNFAGYSLSLFFVGAFSDHYGRKPMILIGLAIFIIGSVLCLFDWSFYYLLAGRFLQGIGIAAPAIVSFLIIADLYPIKQQQFLMSILNGVLNTAVAIAPIAGSYLTLYFDWHGNFTALLFLGVLTLLFTIFFVPNYPHRKKDESMPISGYFALIRSKPLMLLIMNFVLMCVPYYVFIGMSPLLYMQSLGVTLNHFGYYQGILALVFALGSVLFGLSLHHYKQLTWLRAASVIYIIGFVCCAVMTLINVANPLWITLGFIPFIISQVIPSNLLYPLSLNFIPHAKGRISALLQGFRLIITALCLEFAGYLYQGSFLHIGLIMCLFIAMTIFTHFLILKNKSFNKLLQE